MGRIIVIIILLGCTQYNWAQQLSFDFYNQLIDLKYDKSIILKRDFKTSERSLKDFYQTIAKADYQPLLTDLLNYRNKFRLNDWLYYKLIEKVSHGLYYQDTNANFLAWFLMGMSGYKMHIEFFGNSVLVCAECNEIISGILKKGKLYCLNCSTSELGNYYVAAQFNPFVKNKMTFSFKLNSLPTFPNTKYLSKSFEISSPGIQIKNVEIKFSKSLLDAWKDFGGFNLVQSFSVPFSDSAKILVTKIAEITRDFDDSSKVNYILKFITENSLYKDDMKVFGKEKWMFPEEFLYYGRGDCDDYSSLAYYLLKEIVSKPIVIIDYPKAKHVNIGISINLKTPPDFYYKGKPYYVCEPTVLWGIVPVPLGRNLFIRDNKYEIIGEYNPEKESAGDTKN